MNRNLSSGLFALSLCAVLGLLSSHVVVAAEHTTDTLDTVKAKIKSKEAVLLDVREQSEWDNGHLEAAKLLSLSKLRKNLDPKGVSDLLDKDAVIYCHCASGARCLSAADILKKLGYDARPLKPGYQDLLKAGFDKSGE